MFCVEHGILQPIYMYRFLLYSKTNWGLGIGYKTE